MSVRVFHQSKYNDIQNHSSLQFPVLFYSELLTFFAGENSLIDRFKYSVEGEFYSLQFYLKRFIIFGKKAN